MESVVMPTDLLDIHPPLYPPAFSELLLWGVDELLVYHYLVAEVFRYLDMPYEEFWALAKTERSEEHTSELQSQSNLVCRLLLEKKRLKPTRTRCTTRRDVV